MRDLTRTDATKPPDLSILIVAYKRPEILRGCLASLARVKSGLGIETIVIDNSPNPETDRVLADYPNTTVIRNPRNRGFAAANNQGLRVARGRAILLLNDDTVIEESPLAEMLAYLDAHDDVAVVGPRILQADHSLEASTHGFPTLLKEWVHLHPAVKRLLPNRRNGRSLLARIGGRQTMSYWGYDAVRDVDHVTGACFMIKRAAIDQVGALDEQFFFYHEEMEWCYRLKQAKWRTVFIPTGKVVHLGTKCSADVTGALLVERYRGMLYFFSRHYPHRRQLALRTLYIAAFSVRMLASRTDARSRNTCRQILRLSILPLRRREEA